MHPLTEVMHFLPLLVVVLGNGSICIVVVVPVVVIVGVQCTRVAVVCTQCLITGAVPRLLWIDDRERS